MGTLRELNPSPRFTKSLVENRTFENNPLVVVDVGARKGFEKHWNHYGDQIKLVGFEPNEDSYKECIKRKSSAQTTYYPYALDNRRGEKDLYITSYLSGCSFYEPDKKMVKKFGLEDLLNVTQITKVPTIDLDSFSDEYGIQYIDFIKLDTEGSELDILKGAENALKTSVLGLSVEVEFIKLHTDQPLFSDVDQYLRSLGFELYDLDLNSYTRKTLAPYASANLDIGQIVFAQALYLRDVANELESNNSNREFWNQSRVLKMASIQELFNLPDCALELLQKSQSLDLFDGDDIKTWTDCLAPEVNGKNVSYKEYLHRLRVAKPRVDHYKKGKYRKVINIIPWPLSSIIRRLLLKMRDFINLFL